MAAAPLDLDAGHRKAPSDDFNATTSTSSPNSLSLAPSFPLPGLPPRCPQAQPWRRRHGRRHPQPGHLPAQLTAKIGSVHLVEAPPRINSDRNWLTWKPPNPVPLLPHDRAPPTGSTDDAAPTSSFGAGLARGREGARESWRANRERGICRWRVGSHGKDSKRGPWDAKADSQSIRMERLLDPYFLGFL